MFFFQPFFHALNSQDPRIRVLPHYAVDESMLSPDGVTLLEPHATTYMTFLAHQIADLIGFFESRHHRTRWDVIITEDPNLNRTQMTPPPLTWGTPNTSGTWNSHHSTPRNSDEPEKPRYGVRLTMISTNIKNFCL